MAVLRLADPETHRLRERKQWHDVEEIEKKKLAWA
jgi:hypothetical protein